MYCTVEDILASLQTYSFFQKHTLPDESTLQTVGETVANEINGVLATYGYTLPLTDENLIKYCAALNVHGVVAQLIAKLIPQDARPDNVAEKRFEDGIQTLKDRHYVKMAKITLERDNPTW